MVPRENRLPHKELLGRGYQEVATPYFLIKVRHNSLIKNRFSVVIGVSAVKKAAQRNFLRRQAKSALLSIPQKGFDIFIILRSRATLSRKHIFQKALDRAITSLIPHP